MHGRRIRSKGLELSTVSLGDNLDSVPDFLRDIVEQLEQIDDVAVQILTNSEADGWTTNFFTSKPVDIGDHDRQYVMAPGSMIRYRMMCILAITRKNAAPCCLLIVEDDPVFMRLIAAGIQEPDLIHEGVCEAVGDFLLENYRKEVVTVKQVFSHFQI